MGKPKDIGLVIKSKERVLWENQVERSKARLQDNEDSVVIEKAFLSVAKRKLKEAERRDK